MLAGIYDPYLDTLGGGERYCLTVAEILAKNGYSVDLFWSGSPDLLPRATTRFDLDLTPIRLVPDIFHITPQRLELVEEDSDTKPSFSRPSFPPSPLVTKFKTTRRYDLFFYLSDGSVPFLFSRRNFLHIQVPFILKPSPLSSALNFLKSRFIHGTICNSSFTAGFTKKYFPKNLSILYPPVDVAKFSPGKKENLILSVGRFDNILNAKKQDVLIEAFIRLAQQPLAKNWRLVLAGGSLEDQAKNSYLSHLKFLAQNHPIDFVINPDFSTLVDLYARSRLYWHAAGYAVDQNQHPEETEHFGITTVEAMASGTVPLVVARGGLPEIVTHGQTGYLWNSLDDLISQSSLLIGSPQTLSKLSAAAQADSLRFSKDNFANSFLKIINSSHA